MITRDDQVPYIRHYESLAEMVQHIAATPRLWSYATSERNQPSKSWDDGVGWHGALRLARDGWPEGIKALHAMAKLIPTSYAVTRGYDVAGDYPDVGRALGGDPRNMVRRGKVARPRPVVTIAVNMGISASIGGQRMMTYGAALCALVDRLEQRGVRVELRAVCAARTSGEFAVSVVVKHAEDTLDLSAVAFCTAHPAMLRRLILGAYERLPAKFQSKSYGSPTPPKPYHFVDLPDDALILGGAQAAPAECATLEGAAKWMEVQINAKFGANVAELEVV